MSIINIPTYQMTFQHDIETVGQICAKHRSPLLLDCSFDSKNATDPFTVYLEIPFGQFNLMLAQSAYTSGRALTDNRKVRLIVGFDAKGVAEIEIAKAIIAIASCRFVDGILLNPPNLSEVFDSLNVGLHIPETDDLGWSRILSESLTSPSPSFCVI